VILDKTPYTGADMATFLNVGRMDRALRVVLGIGLGIAGILVNGHSYLGWALGIAGVLVILSGTCGI
jgi:Inner membrane protein YgaP-like, transmembrane domain